MQNSSTSQIVSGLSHAFRQELEKFPNFRTNNAGTQVHRLQVNFMYAIDMVMRGSAPEVEAGISSVKKLISEMRKTNAS